MSSLLPGRAVDVSIDDVREETDSCVLAHTGAAYSTPGASVSQPDDEILMAQLRAPDREALRILFDRYSRLVFGIAFRALRDHGEAQDVVQDTFFYVYERAALFDPRKGSAKAWIGQVAFHRALDRKAHLQRRGFYRGVGIEFVNNRLPGTTDLDREVGAKLDRQKLERAFADLSEEQHKTLSLYYFEGLDLREIADRLQEPVANVRHFYYRGLERLSKNVFVRKLRQDCL